MAAETAERREWTVTGMDCAACTTKVVRAVERLPGVSDVKVALMTERLSLNLVPGSSEPKAIEGTVRKLGFGIAPKGQQAPRKKAFVLPDEGPVPRAEDGAADDPDLRAPARDAAPALQDKAWHQTAKGRLVILTGALLAIAWLIELLTGTSKNCPARVAAV